ncbi:MAG TPA: DUF6573 family protein [Humisphaera sp.]
MADVPDSPAEDDVVFRYTREQAIADGVLVDLTEWARETGFVVPVACTAAVWDGYVVPDSALAAQGQSARGRGHDLLWMLFHAIRSLPPGGGGGERLGFDVLFLMPPETRETVRLAAVIGPGDDAEPVLTVMLPYED